MEPSKSHIISPKALTTKERAYYRTTWGFDPVGDMIAGSPQGLNEYQTTQALYAYETPIPLECDPELAAAGVTLHALVEVVGSGDFGESHNLIVFRRGTRYETAECVHTAVYSAPAGEVEKFSPADLGNLVDSTEGDPAILPPWEHFAALKSFVAGLASLGILRLVRTNFLDQGKSGEDTPGGVSGMLLAQISGVLHRIAPEVPMPGFLEHFGDLLERMPWEWLAARWDWITERQYASGGGSTIESSILSKEFLDSLDDAVRTKLIEIYLQHREKGNRTQYYLEPEVLPALLAGKFRTRLSASLQHRILQSITALNENYFGDKAIGKVFKTLLIHAIQREDPSLLAPDFLREVDFMLIEYSCIKKIENHLRIISLGYLQDLARTYISIWKKESDYDSNYLFYWVLQALLRRDRNSPSTKKIMDDVYEIAPPNWEAEYLRALEDWEEEEFNEGEDLEADSNTN